MRREGIPGQDPPTPEVGNLTWALHNVWLSYRHTMDESILRDVLFPLPRKAIDYDLMLGDLGLPHPARFGRTPGNRGRVGVALAVLGAG